MLGLKDKLFVVTGGAGGIGQAIATRIAEFGGRVVITDLDRDPGDAVAAAIRSATGGDVRFRQLDVTDPDAAKALADSVEAEIGPVQGLVTAAGICIPSDALDHSVDLWRKTFAVNVEGTFFPIQAFARHMMGRNASIVTIASICASVVVSPERHVAYGASKAAVKHMTALLGVEWARKGIRVNGVAPNHTDTPILKKFKETDPVVYETWRDKIPLGRLSEPGEIAGAVVFLLSDLSTNMCGETIHADGGCTKAF